MRQGRRHQTARPRMTRRLRPRLRLTAEGETMENHQWYSIAAAAYAGQLGRLNTRPPQQYARNRIGVAAEKKFGAPRCRIAPKK